MPTLSSSSRLDPIEIQGSIVTLILLLRNGSETDLGASQCIPIDLDADAAAWCVYTLRNNANLPGSFYSNIPDNILYMYLSNVTVLILIALTTECSSLFMEIKCEWNRFYNSFFNLLEIIGNCALETDE